MDIIAVKSKTDVPEVNRKLIPVVMGGARRFGCRIGCDYCCAEQHETIAPGFQNPVVIAMEYDALNLEERPEDKPDEIVEFRRFLNMGVLRGPTCFNVRSDGGLPEQEEYRNEFLDTTLAAGDILAVLISKQPQSLETLREWKRKYPHLVLLPGITGMGAPIERVTVDEHVETVANAVEADISMAVNCSPAVETLSELDQLAIRLKKAGAKKMVLRGFSLARDPKYMSKIKAALAARAPAALRRYMEAPIDEMILFDGAEEMVRSAGLEVVTQQDFLLDEWKALCSRNGIRPSTREEEMIKLNLLLPRAYLYGQNALECSLYRRCCAWMNN